MAMLTPPPHLAAGSGGMPTRSSRKRASSVSSSSPEPTVPTKKRATGSRASDRAAKKELRMERNRIAAQASRDRKRVQQESLQSKIQTLERQLAQANMTLAAAAASSSSSSGSPRCSIDTPSASVTPAATLYLVEENDSLRAQLEEERLQSAALKGRLGALEAKFSRLESLLSSDVSDPVPTPPASTTLSSIPFTLHTIPSPSMGPMPFLDLLAPPLSSSIISDVATARGHSPPRVNFDSHTIGDSATALTTPNATTGLSLDMVSTTETSLDNLGLSAREASLPRRLSNTSRSTEPCPAPTRLPIVSSISSHHRHQPTLHEILSAISVTPRSSTTPLSVAPGTTGPRVSLWSLKSSKPLASSISTIGFASPRPRRRMSSQVPSSRRALSSITILARSRTMPTSAPACSRSSVKAKRYQLFTRRP